MEDPNDHSFDLDPIGHRGPELPKGLLAISGLSYSGGAPLGVPICDFECLGLLVASEDTGWLIRRNWP